MQETLVAVKRALAVFAVPSTERGGQNLGAVARHIGYLSRTGELEIETDAKP